MGAVSFQRYKRRSTVVIIPKKVKSEQGKSNDIMSVDLSVTLLPANYWDKTISWPDMPTETILVIDDSREIADFLAGKLLPNLGYQTLVAYTGHSALELIHAHGRLIDLLVVDFQLPDLSGLELLSQLNSEGYTFPAIMVTAHGSDQVAQDAYQLGVQDYLKKPIESEALIHALQHASIAGKLQREKKKLTDQLQRQVSRLDAMAKVGQSVTSTLNLDEVLRRIVEASVQLTHAEEGFLALLDAQSQQLYLRAAKNLDEAKIKTMRLPVNDSLVGSVMRSKKPLRTILPVEGSQLKVVTGYLVNSLLHVPILSRGRALGVLSVDNRTSARGFQEDDEMLLCSLADYAAVAIENARLYQQARDEITQRKQVEQALRTSEERYVLAVRGANDGIWDWDLHTQKVYFSSRWKAMLGYKDDEIGDRVGEWLDRIHPNDRERVQLELKAHVRGAAVPFESEYRIQHRDGQYRWMLARGLAVQDANGLATRVAGSQTDITLRKQAEEKLVHDAFHDALTDLPNRALLLDRLSYAVERAKRRENYLFAVLLLDLDRFKDVNDTLGHIAGDNLLCAMSKVLLELVRPTDTVARFGGDEFVILLEDIKSIHDATLIAERLQHTLQQTSLLPDHHLHITASVGIVISTTGYPHPEDVLRDADIAMFRAKTQGKARYEIFDPTMREHIMERLELESDLHRAISRGELRASYQPILSVSQRKVIGFEALVRWQHPARGLLTPDAFIQLAEETGMIIQLDRWMIREVCRQMQLWQQEYKATPPLVVSVNISGKQFSQPDLVEFIKFSLQEANLEPSCLKLEVTESAIIEDFDLTIETLKRLKEIGVESRLDDFGKGYSSLSYLAQFPIHALKIDYLFVSKMAQDNRQAEIVHAIIMLAHSLGLQVVAEGVESEEQLTQLRKMGCEHAQGFFISKPLSTHDTGQLIAATKYPKPVMDA
jgi:diguanylate cyclase (GGDEF)-like protein/PAS domain S-box-containing protein